MSTAEQIVSSLQAYHIKLEGGASPESLQPLPGAQFEATRKGKYLGEGFDYQVLATDPAQGWRVLYNGLAYTGSRITPQGEIEIEVIGDAGEITPWLAERL